MTKQTKKIISIVIKISVVVFAFWFIYVNLIENKNLKKFIVLLKEMPVAQIWTILGIVLALMFLNWGLEALKWKRLIRHVEEISVWKAIESVFCGLTWAVFTPNRIGEYGGRVFFLPPRRRVVGVVAMIVGSISQLVLTNIFGAIAACFFIYRFTPIDQRLFFGVCALALVLCLFFILFYFNIKSLNSFLLSMRMTRKYEKFYVILASYPKDELFKIISFSFVRYVVFSSQYLIMFLWLIPGIKVLDVIMLVSVLFFIQAYIPSLDLLDIGIRSITSVELFKYVTDQNAAVVACTASIWLINLIIPAILGSYFVFKLNFFGSTQRN